MRNFIIAILLFISLFASANGGSTMLTEGKCWEYYSYHFEDDDETGSGNGTVTKTVSTMDFTPRLNGLCASETEGVPALRLPVWIYTCFTDWHVEQDVVTGVDGHEIQYCCEGDSVTIGNRKYAKLVNGGLYTPVSGSRISQNTEGRDYVIGIRHEGGRVYVNYAEYQDYLRQRGYSQYYDVFPHGNPDYIPYATTADGEMVLYDYTMEVGDGFVHLEGYDDVTVVSKEIIMLDNQTARRRLVLSNGLVLIEGIGCINSNGMLLDYLNPLSSLQTRFTYLNLLFDLNTNTKVYENSEIEVYDLRRLAVPEVMQNEKKGERTAYDLQGRPLKQKPSKGLYIENGKKMVAQ